MLSIVVARSYVQHTVRMCKIRTTPSSGLLAVQGQGGCVRSTCSRANDAMEFYNGLTATRRATTTKGGHRLMVKDDVKQKIKSMPK